MTLSIKNISIMSELRYLIWDAPQYNWKGYLLEGWLCEIAWLCGYFDDGVDRYHIHNT